MLKPGQERLPPVIADWFARKGWEPRRHQLEMLAAAHRGRNALLVAPTGAGKTMAGFLATLTELIEKPVSGLHTLYVSPLKALAVDVQRNLLTPIEEMGGRGVGGSLVQAAVDYARDAGLELVVTCPFAKKWLEKHPVG